MPSQINRLIHEKSPYLLQHADNPVDWYPWGKEAFEKAKREDKPIFLSIGYSTCHWCHVMEHESFEDPKVAEKMNAYFVPIKVDREERPDLDSVYMSAVMAMTGQGGWPLTVILTPDRKPFFGGTYYPPYPKWGSPGLVELMESIHKAWQNNRQELIESSISLTELLQQKFSSEKSPVSLEEDIFETAFKNYLNTYDQRFGGFGQAPKFPSSHNLSFLLRYWKRSGDPESLKVVEHTLQAMAKGGMYDHLGGGFHRYSTDQEWRVPHFEKMLYDQAILARTYLEATQITKNDFYAQIAREILDYVLTDLQHAQGGFYSAEDADSLDPEEKQGLKKEGSFYVWRQEEIKNILGVKDAEIFSYYFGVILEGNVPSDPHGEFQGKNILYQQHNLGETSKHFEKSVSEIQGILKNCKQKLFEERKKRPRPHLDDKILVDWNGLMISSLAFGSRVLKEPKYKEAAKKGADFILKNLVTPEGKLLHRYRDGQSAIAATLDDYAFFTHALLDLYEAAFEVKYLEEATRLSEAMLKNFWDEAQGGFFLTAQDAEDILFRPKEIYDGAMPSGNAIAALNLGRLGHLTFDNKWEEKVKSLFESFSSEVKQRPQSYAQLLIALDFVLGPVQEIVIAGKKDDPQTQIIGSQVFQYFLPRKVVMFKEQNSLQGDVSVNICENHVCKLPLWGIEKIEETLSHL